MTISQVHTGVKLKIDKTDSFDYTSFLPEEIDFWLNQACLELEKTRFTGVNPKQESFEQTQKRVDDLRTLIRDESIVTTVGTVKPNSYVAALPSNYLFTLGEECDINYIKRNYSVVVSPGANALVIGNVYLTGSVGVYTLTVSTGYVAPNTIFIAPATYLSGGNVTLLYTQRTAITQITTDRYSQSIDNPYSPHTLHYYTAKPLRLFNQDDVELVTDGNYYVSKYHLRYLKYPRAYSNATKTVEQGTIEEGVTYKVVQNAQGINFTYDNVSYTNGQIFTGVAGVTSWYSEYAIIVKQVSVADVPEYLHDEIINLAVLMMIENTGDTNRFQTNSIQLNKME